MDPDTLNHRWTGSHPGVWGGSTYEVNITLYGLTISESMSTARKSPKTIMPPKRALFMNRHTPFQWPAFPKAYLTACSEDCLLQILNAEQARPRQAS